MASFSANDASLPGFSAEVPALVGCLFLVVASLASPNVRISIAGRASAQDLLSTRRVGRAVATEPRQRIGARLTAQRPGPKTHHFSAITALGIALHVHEHLPFMRRPPMFPQEHALPRAEAQLAVDDGNDFARAGDGRFCVSRHVVTSLVIMFPGARLWRQIAEPAAKIMLHAYVSILLNHQACRRVSDKHGAKAHGNSALFDDVAHLGRDVDRTLSPG